MTWRSSVLAALCCCTSGAHTEEKVVNAAEPTPSPAVSLSSSDGGDLVIGKFQPIAPLLSSRAVNEGAEGFTGSFLTYRNGCVVVGSTTQTNGPGATETTRRAELRGHVRCGDSVTFSTGAMTCECR